MKKIESSWLKYERVAELYLFAINKYFLSKSTTDKVVSLYLVKYFYMSEYDSQRDTRIGYQTVELI